MPLCGQICRAAEKPINIFPLCGIKTIKRFTALRLIRFSARQCDKIFGLEVLCGSASLREEWFYHCVLTPNVGACFSHLVFRISDLIRASIPPSQHSNGPVFHCSKNLIRVFSTSLEPPAPRTLEPFISLEIMPDYDDWMSCFRIFKKKGMSSGM